jgi:metal-sulfur cluster biosynthetic enzyme
MTDSTLLESVQTALAGVVDPCSRFIGSNLSFAELGMIDSVEANAEGDVAITLLLDDPTCLYMVEIEHSLRHAALAVPGVQSVAVTVRWDELWTEERATEQARAALLDNRSRRVPRPLPLLNTQRIEEGT